MVTASAAQLDQRRCIAATSPILNKRNDERLSVNHAVMLHEETINIQLNRVASETEK